MSSVNDQLTILTASKSRVYNGSEQAQDIRQLRKEMDALRQAKQILSGADFGAFLQAS